MPCAHHHKRQQPGHARRAVGLHADGCAQGRACIGRGGAAAATARMLAANAPPTTCMHAGNITVVRAGEAHACSHVASNGQLLCWGEQADGMSTVPGKLLSITQWAQPISVGAHHSIVVLPGTQQAVCIGSNDFGQCNVPGGSKTKWAVVSAGHRFSCGIRAADKRLLCWGGSSRDAMTVPAALANETWATVSSGCQLACAITSGPARRLHCWGSGATVPAALADAAWEWVETQHVDCEGEAYGSRFRFCGKLLGGRTVCWGVFDTPEVPGRLRSASWQAMAVGMRHTVGLLANQSMAGWGDSFFGQADVPAIWQDSRWASVAAGHDFTCASLADGGKVVCWGTSDTAQTTPPAALRPPPRAWAAVSAGSEVTCGVTRAGGRATCFGRNDDNNAVVPMTLAKTAFAAVAAGWGHTW